MISFPVALAALLVAAAFVPLRDFVVDPDVWWHLKVGTRFFPPTTGLLWTPTPLPLTGAPGSLTNGWAK